MTNQVAIRVGQRWALNGNPKRVAEVDYVDIALVKCPTSSHGWVRIRANWSNRGAMFKTAETLRKQYRLLPHRLLS